jgi:ATP/maltotriose-dependent transcriptional regulator MalT
MEGYSTVLRVEFVLECMRDHEGTRYELMNKCSCVLDQLGEAYSADDFVDASTTAKAITISGERGAALRDNEQAKQLARTFRDSVKHAKANCFLN